MNDAVIILYPDAVTKPGEKPLQTIASLPLSTFATYHVLPFFPCTSDRGFAVSDYYAVDPAFGDWSDLPKPLMIDCIFNHTSSQHPWLNTNKDYYVHYAQEPKTTLFRPRTSPLFTRFSGEYYWSTFSSDQIDLNFRNPKVQQEFDNIITFYQEQGATHFRLDAIAYLFKDVNAISIPETHAYIQHIQKKFPDITFIAEVNLSQEEIDAYRSYVHAYNFSLPPLTYYAFLTGDAQALTEHLNKDSHNYFNFLASHDGIGLTAAKKQIPIEVLQDDVRKKGWHASDYELNINYFDALDNSIEAFVSAHAILLFIQGIPAVYIHSYFGSRGTSHETPREVNRAPLSYDDLMYALSQDGERKKIFEAITRLITLRKEYLGDEKQQATFTNGILHIQRGTHHLYINLSTKIYDMHHYDLITQKKRTQLYPKECAWVQE